MTRLSRIIQAWLAAIALAVPSALALAQSNDSLQEVQVIAFRPVIATIQDKSGRRVEIIRLSRVVSYADLDIATPAGAATLRRRVRKAAMGICVQLKHEYPKTTPYGSCLKDAVNSATPEVDAAIAAAQGQTSQSAQAPSRSP